MNDVRRLAVNEEVSDNATVSRKAQEIEYAAMELQDLAAVVESKSDNENGLGGIGGIIKRVLFTIEGLAGEIQIDEAAREKGDAARVLAIEVDVEKRMIANRHAKPKRKVRR